jgi:hypothetical protein
LTTVKRGSLPDSFDGPADAGGATIRNKLPVKNNAHRMLFGFIVPYSLKRLAATKSPA